MISPERFTTEDFKMLSLKPRRAAPGPVIVTMPKSGTDFVDNALMRAASLTIPDVYSDPERMARLRTGYYGFDEPVVGIGNFDTQFLNAPWLKRYVQAGNMVSLHAAGVHYNLAALSHAGIRRITVLMRDPRDSTVSMMHHVRNGGPAQRRNLMLFLYLPADYYDWPAERQMKHLVRTYLPRCVSWVESWLGAFQAEEHDLSINLMLFDQLKQDSRSFLKRIADFHEIADCDLTKVPQREETAHFRRGEHSQWLEEFDQEDREFARVLIGDRIYQAFDTAAQAHRHRPRAIAATQVGDFHKAAHHWLKVLQQFPCDQAGFEGLDQALTAANAPLPQDVREAITGHFAARPDPMRWPARLVDAVTAACDGIAHSPDRVGTERI